MLQFITNSDDKGTVLNQAKLVLDGGCKWIQLRMKNSARDTIVDTASELKSLCAQYEAILIIDDYVEIAKELQLDGVHLGKNDAPASQARVDLGMQSIIGVTANTFDDILAASRLDIDYIGLGPFRFTSTKKNLSPIIGIDGYASIMEQCKAHDIKIPTVAIGGICLDDIEAIMAAGVSGVAVSGAIINATDPASETRNMITILNDIVQKRIDKIYNR